MGILISALMWACFWRLVYAFRHRKEPNLPIWEELLAFTVTFVIIVTLTYLFLGIAEVFKFLNAIH